MSHTTLVLAGVNSYISGNISFPFFIAKNATVTAYLLESSLARFKKSRLLFYSDKVFARIQINNENIQLLLLGSLFVFSSVKERESSYSVDLSAQTARKRKQSNEGNVRNSPSSN